MAYTTVSVSGTKTFTAWEWTCQATIATKIPSIPAEVGEVVKMSGCSLFWWDMSAAGDDGDGDGKVKAMVEYSKGF